ncbi:hypothetical protein HOLleu_14821 [Holothuria leucospilota]|uniref:Uncharacterized protein n=1 Tax=Holothuria leucospilota TaxID=206669 RepID=A0A9Q1C967_HOLLE|nr:hypothetical protein HOLleu_14821 [Holothuria leucospilota]
MLKTLLTRYLKMRYGKRKSLIVLGGGQRSSGVTGSRMLKTLLTLYLKMCYGKRKNPIILVAVKDHLGSLEVKL